MQADFMHNGLLLRCEHPSWPKIDECGEMPQVLDVTTRFETIEFRRAKMPFERIADGRDFAEEWSKLPPRERCIALKMILEEDFTDDLELRRRAALVSSYIANDVL
jgi:hypothetical protein